MTFTFLTNLVVGALTSGVSAILAMSGVPVGSLITGGNLYFDTTNNASPAIYVGTKQVMGVSAGGLNFTTNGTASGVVLKDNGIVAFASRTVNCVGTGGLTGVYDTCLIPPLLTTTGSITRLSLMVSASPVSVGIDCGFTKAVHTSTGTVFTNFNNVSTGSGSIANFGTGAIRWNSADFIKCGTLGTPTAAFSAKFKVDYFDDTSE